MTRFRTARGVGSLVAFVATFAVGFLPLFSGPGYEHAIASGLVLPTIAALVAAAEGFSNRTDVAPRTALELVLRGMTTGVLLSTVAIATSLAHGFVSGLCDPLGGVATFLLGPGAGTVLAGAIGAVVAACAGHVLAARRRRRRTAMGIAGLAPLATAVTALAYFYETPAVFAFDPFVGFFSGTLYDEVVDAFVPLLTYRAGTALTLLAAVLASASLARSVTGQFSVARRPFLVLAALCFVGSMTLVARGSDLGHRSTADTIRAALGGVRAGPRCEVVHPRSLSEAEANSLVRDCEEQLAAVEARLGVPAPARVTAFFFRDAGQKRRLMGAADTYVAKPWRREVYLQVAPYPHPVLGHELAHVVAGSMARGPFKIAGDAYGLLPNPGLVEGIAVFASPDRDELAPSQWALAMKRLGILPKLSKTFGSGFLAQNSAMAYTVAGAFVEWAYANGKGASVRAWYSGVPFEQAFGTTFARAEDAWKASLDQVVLPDEALLVAKGRFDRPAIWGRRCPHVVERLRDEADECRDEGDLAGSDAKLVSLLRLDETDPSARFDRAALAERRGDDATRRTLLESIEGDARVAATFRQRAREALGDDALRDGRLVDARRLYEATRREVLDEDHARNLDVKVFATTSEARAALFGRMLVGRGRAHEKKDDALATTIALARLLGKSEANPGSGIL